MNQSTMLHPFWSNYKYDNNQSEMDKNEPLKNQYSISVHLLMKTVARKKNELMTGIQSN